MKGKIIPIVKFKNEKKREISFAIRNFYSHIERTISLECFVSQAVGTIILVSNTFNVDLKITNLYYMFYRHHLCLKLFKPNRSTTFQQKVIRF